MYYRKMETFDIYKKEKKGKEKGTKTKKKKLWNKSIKIN